MHFHDNKLSTLTGEARTYAYPGIPRKYREVYLHLMADLGCVVDFDLGCSTVCLIQLGLMGIWQKRLDKMVQHQNQIQPNQFHEQMEHPVNECEPYFRSLTFQPRTLFVL